MQEETGPGWILLHRFGHAPQTFRTDTKTIYVFGNPICSKDRSVIDTIAHANSYKSAATQFDGEFAIAVNDGRSFSVMTDRYGSIPVFYAVIDGELLLSPDYLPLWRRLRERGELTIDSEAFFEFLYFQRLFGERTYDHQSCIVPPSTVLEVNDSSDEPSFSQYWSPDPTKESLDLDDWGRRLAKALSLAVSRRIDEGDECGLLLSGGLDSRALLAAFPDEVTPTCYTLGDRRNNEVEVASELASAADADHVFVEREDGYYEDCIERAVRIGGGMYTFDHAHFLSLDEHLDVDVLFHGHGLDYLFQGMYLPTERLAVAGHPTYFERLKDVDSSLISAYRDEISYRLTDDTMSYLGHSNCSTERVQSLNDSLQSVLSTAPSRISVEHDYWDYLHVYHQARHYTHLNVLSIPDELGQRTAAFDENLLECFWSMPVEMRVQGKALKRAISHLNDELLAIRDANTNLPADATPLELTARASWHALTRRVPFLPVTHEYPSAEDRSWPDRNDLVRNRDRIRERAESLVESHRLATLDILPLDDVARLVDDHLAGRADCGAGILSLITIDEFLKQGGLPE